MRLYWCAPRAFLLRIATAAFEIRFLFGGVIVFSHDALTWIDCEQLWMLFLCLLPKEEWIFDECASRFSVSNCDGVARNSFSLEGVIARIARQFRCLEMSMALGPTYQMKLSLDVIAMLFAKVNLWLQLKVGLWPQKSICDRKWKSVCARKSRSVIALKVGLCPQKSICDRNWKSICDRKSRSVIAMKVGLWPHNKVDLWSQWKSICDRITKSICDRNQRRSVIAKDKFLTESCSTFINRLLNPQRRNSFPHLSRLVRVWNVRLPRSSRTNQLRV